MGEQIQCTGSAIPAVRLVIDPHESVLNGAYKLLAKGAVNVVEGVERQRRRVVRVADGHYFWSGGACQDDERCYGIGWWEYSCCRKGRIDGGGEGVVQVSESATANVGVDGRRVRV